MIAWQLIYLGILQSPMQASSVAMMLPECCLIYIMCSSVHHNFHSPINSDNPLSCREVVVPLIGFVLHILYHPVHSFDCEQACVVCRLRPSSFVLRPKAPRDSLCRI